MKNMAVALMLIFLCVGCSTTKAVSSSNPSANQTSLVTKKGQKVGVVPFAGPGRLGLLAYESFIGELMNYSNLDLERRQQQERESQMEGFESDLLDRKQLQEIGRIYQVDVLCFGKVETEIKSDFLGSYVYIKAFDVKSGRVVFEWQQKGQRWYDEGVEGSVSGAAKKAAHVFKRKILK